MCFSNARHPLVSVRRFSDILPQAAAQAAGRFLPPKEDKAQCIRPAAAENRAAGLALRKLVKAADLQHCLADGLRQPRRPASFLRRTRASAYTALPASGL